MKANISNKIYTDRNGNNLFPIRHCHSDIEYTCTDAFIEKACEFLFENYHGEKLSLRMIEDFKNYMKGE